MKAKPTINILFGKNKEKIESYVPHIVQMFDDISVSTVVSELKSNKVKQTTVEDKNRISKYRKVTLPFEENTLKLLFLMAINILQFDCYFLDGNIYVKKNVFVNKDLKLISKFIKFKLMFLTEKHIVPYENKTKYY